MERANKVMANAAFAIIILLSFLLFFEERLVLPASLQAFGRMHPLLLHLPIGLLLLTGLLVLLHRHFEGKSFDKLINFLLHLAVVTASLTALMGLFLSREGGYNELELQLHKWFGIATCYAGGALLIVQHKKRVFKVVFAWVIIILITAGHYGAMLTHGENFVLGPFQKNAPKAGVTEDASVFEAVVQPLFDRRCAGCHNETKAKGKLIVTSLEQIMKGGKSGKLWNVNDIHNSLLAKRLLLPLEDKKHMPPKDKPQLTADELAFISIWLGYGADVKKRLNDYPEGDSLRQLASKLMATAEPGLDKALHYDFDFASSEKIEALNNPYRTVFQLSQDEPALQAEFFVRQEFDRKSLEALTAVGEQVVAISLARMPVTDDDLKLLTKFSNLEMLNLNSSDVAGEKLSDLRELDKLKSLSLSGTKVTARHVSVLGSFKNLRKVFVWNTAVSASDLEDLKQNYPDIEWEIGYIPDAKEVLKLSKPLLASEPLLKAGEKIVLKASLPGTIIRYTTDGTDPDSLAAPVYTAPLEARAYQLVKAAAFRDGWKRSEVADFIIFKTGYKPSRGELKTIPEPQYKGEGISTFSDGKKGSPDFFRDPVWMAYRNGPLEAVFYFDDAPEIGSVTLSYADNIYAMTMAPGEMEVWGGNDEHSLSLLQRVKPVQPEGYGPTRVRGIEVTFPAAKRRCYKIIAKPLSKFPAFYKTKDKGWLMVDEIFFN